MQFVIRDSKPGRNSLNEVNNYPNRVLLAKIGLDGHDRGAKVLARSFRDAGIEVIYTGLWQTCEGTMHAALQEDVDVVGVSLLSAAHMTVMPNLLRIRNELGIEHIPVMLGGIVPEADHPAVLEMGVAAVFNPGSPIDRIIDKLKELAGQRESWEFDEIRAGYGKKEVRSLAKLISGVQRGDDLHGWIPPQGQARIIGVTGAPGVGKSSFIGKLGQRLRQREQHVAVVAIDPSSPITGGALLGDRLRMMGATPDENFFVRSLSSGGASGGLSPHCEPVIKILDGFGFDYILVETVGAGQADVGIRDLVHHTVLLLMPDSGDSIQFSKAGIIEVANCFVVNKCDLAGADATEAQLRSALGDSRPIWQVSTIRDEGIDAVADWVTSTS